MDPAATSGEGLRRGEVRAAAGLMAAAGRGNGEGGGYLWKGGLGRLGEGASEAAAVTCPGRTPVAASWGERRGATGRAVGLGSAQPARARFFLNKFREKYCVEK